MRRSLHTRDPALPYPLQMHGATYTVDAEFKTDALVDKSNWVVDIGAASSMLAEVLSKYNFKNLNEIFPGQNTTTEFMCKVGRCRRSRAVGLGVRWSSEQQQCLQSRGVADVLAARYSRTARQAWLGPFRSDTGAASVRPFADVHAMSEKQRVSVPCRSGDLPSPLGPVSPTIQRRDTRSSCGKKLKWHIDTPTALWT